MYYLIVANWDVKKITDWEHEARTYFETFKYDLEPPVFFIEGETMKDVCDKLKELERRYRKDE